MSRLGCNPRDYTEIFTSHNEYKHHLNSLFKVKGRVDFSEPKTNKFTHLRPKTFKQDAFREREVQAENDNLVLKILHIRSGKGNTHSSTFHAGQSRVVTMAQRRSLSGLKQRRSQSAQSARSTKSARNRALHRSILEEDDKRRRSEDEGRQKPGPPRSRSGLRRQVHEIRKQKAYNDLILRQLARSASVSSRHRSTSASKLPLGSRFGGVEGIPEHAKGARKRLINVGNIQIDEQDLKKQMHRNMLN